jgi:hypothetical protein
MGTFSVLVPRLRKNGLVASGAVFLKKENVPGYSSPRMITRPTAYPADEAGAPA